MCHFPNKVCIVCQLRRDLCTVLSARFGAYHSLRLQGKLVCNNVTSKFSFPFGNVLSQLPIFFGGNSVLSSSRGSLPLPSQSSRRVMLLNKSSVFIILLSNNNPKVKERNDPFSLIDVLDRCEKQLFGNRKKRS